MDSEDIVAVLSFLDWQDEYSQVKPYELFIDIPENITGVEMTNCVFKKEHVPIKDARGSEDNLSLDKQGFVYRKHITSLTNEDLGSQEKVQEIYYAEMEALLRREIGDISKIHFFDWRIRKHQPQPPSGPLDLNDRTVYLRPAIEMHVDQSPAAVVKRVQLQFRSHAPDLLNGRVRIINVWRPLVKSIKDWPLTLCDGRSVCSKDLVETDNIRKHYTGSTMYVVYNPKQEWYYLSRQGREEVTIFKTFDSVDHTGNRATGTPHGAFELADIPEDAEPRTSIEVRAMVFSDA